VRLAAISSLAIPILAASAAAQNQVWVVDDGGGAGVDFTDIQPAVDAAADGDVVLVRTGTYQQSAPLLIGDESLTIAADQGAVVELRRGVSVAGLSAGKRVLLAQLHQSPISPGGFIAEAGLSVSSSSGMVWADQCSFEGSAGCFMSEPFVCFVPPTDGIAVNNAATVVLTRCSAIGGSIGDVGGYLPESGIVVGAFSSAYVSDSTAIGGTNAVSPASGVRFGGSTMFAAHSTFMGAPTTFGACGCGGGPGCPTSFAGGTGLHVEAPGGTVQLFGTSLVGGSAIPGFPCTQAGQASVVVSGSLEVLDGPNHDFFATSPVSEGQSYSLTVTGAPGDLAFVLAATGTGVLSLPPLIGPLLVSPDFALVPLGAINLFGFASVGGALVELGPGNDGVVLALQSAFVLPTGTAILSDAAPMVLLDAAF
jgi:hypothetical protein